jgi:hypothetical protein
MARQRHMIPERTTARDAKSSALRAWRGGERALPLSRTAARSREGGPQRSSSRLAGFDRTSRAPWHSAPLTPATWGSLNLSSFAEPPRAKAFMRIENGKLRRALVALIEDCAEL